MYNELMITSRVDFVTFNYPEGLLWFDCAVLVTACMYKWRHAMPRWFWYSLICNFVLFGTSDWVEARWEIIFLNPEGYWLYAWKIMCLVGFGFLLIHYLHVQVLRIIRRH